MSLVYLFFLFMPGTVGDTQRERLMAGSSDHWPSMAVTYEYSVGRRFVLERLKEDPDVLLVTSRAAAFYWDPTVDASRIHETNCGGIRTAAYFEGPVRILILTFDEGAPDEVWRYNGNSTFGYPARATVLRAAAGSSADSTLPGRRHEAARGECRAGSTNIAELGQRGSHEGLTLLAKRRIAT